MGSSSSTAPASLSGSGALNAVNLNVRGISALESTGDHSVQGWTTRGPIAVNTDRGRLEVSRLAIVGAPGYGLRVASGSVSLEHVEVVGTVPSDIGPGAALAVASGHVELRRFSIRGNSGPGIWVRQNGVVDLDGGYLGQNEPNVRLEGGDLNEVGDVLRDDQED